MAEVEKRRLLDGFKTLEAGTQEGKSPSLLGNNQCARAFNTTFRGGYATCRPPYKKFILRFQNAEQRDWFLTHNVQGRHIYRSPLGSITIIVSIGGRIFKIDPKKTSSMNVVELTPTGDANPMRRPHVWMEQAENYLIIQDGQSTPLIYDGAVCRRSSLGDPQYEVPVGCMMAYGLGRLVVVRPHRRSYVIGDIVHGGTEVIQFTEDNYLNEGGDIVVPLPGEITSVKFTAQIDRSTGQGDLVVSTQYGACTARVGEKRETWKDIPFQMVAMLGFGFLSQNSTTVCNGDIFFRATDGIRSLAMWRQGFQSSWDMTPISREISKTLSFDSPSLLGFCESVLFDNRLLTLCNQSPLPNGCYHRGIAVLDFDLISGMSEKTAPAYDGLWTGLNATAIVAGDFGSGDRCFIFHRNADGENELWELLKSGNYDDGVNPIVWTIEGMTMLRMGATPQSLKQLNTGDISYEGAYGIVHTLIQFKPDQAPCWTTWHEFTICAKTRVCDGSCSQPITYLPQYRTKKRFPQPPDTCNTSDNKRVRFGFEFQPRITITGKAVINTFRMSATEITENLDGCAVDEV
jgi:hypothetical protein